MSTKAAKRAVEASQRRRRRRWRLTRRLALGAIVLAVLAVGAWTWRQTQPRATIPSAGELPTFTLVDEHAQPLTRATLSGRAIVFSFVSFHDATHSPALLREIRALAEDVRNGPMANRIAVVTLTVSPVEDSPDHLRALAAELGVAPPWSIASGQENEVIALLDGLDVDWRRLQAERAKYGSPIFADNRLVLVDGRGQMRGEYDATSWTAMRRLRGELFRVATGEGPERKLSKGGEREAIDSGVLATHQLDLRHKNARRRRTTLCTVGPDTPL